METLITPAQVARMAFTGPDFITEEAVPAATILAAEQKFVRPVLGGSFCAALLRGAYPEFLTDYLQPALALYVKMLMLPSLAVQTGSAGIVEVNSRNLARAGEGKLRAAVLRVRRDALALMRRAVEYLESSPAGTWPEYDPAANVLNRCSMDGGIVLPAN
jgi:hypothetical protein